MTPPAARRVACMVALVAMATVVAGRALVDDVRAPAARTTGSVVGDAIGPTTVVARPAGGERRLGQSDAHPLDAGPPIVLARPAAMVTWPGSAPVAFSDAVSTGIAGRAPPRSA